MNGTEVYILTVMAGATLLLSFIGLMFTALRAIFAVLSGRDL